MTVLGFPWNNKKLNFTELTRHGRLRPAHKERQRGATSREVRGRSWEDPMPERCRPRGVTPRSRSGAAAESARLRRCRKAKRSYPSPRSGAVAKRSYSTSEVRGSWEEPPRIQSKGWRPGGAIPRPRSGGCWVQEGLEELSHTEGQEGRR